MNNKTVTLSHEKKTLLKKELNHYQKFEEHLKSTLIDKANRSEREDWALENIAKDLGYVAQQDVRDINFPTYINKILNDENLVELYDIFNDIIDINNQFIGYHNDEAKAILNGDPRILDSLQRIFVWVESYVESRIKKRNPKYGDCQPLKWQCIVQELEPFLNQYAFKKETLFNIFLPDWCRYILFYTYVKTWADMIPIEANKHVVDMCIPIDLVRESPYSPDHHRQSLGKSS